MNKDEQAKIDYDMKGIAIIYKNGIRDWFDPVIMEETINDTLRITIENGYTYDIHLPDIQSINYYEASREAI